MAERTPEHPNTEQGEHPEPNASEPRSVRSLRRARTAALAIVVALPPTLNAQNIVEWANSPDGLNLPITWAWVAFGGLDLIAFVCVLETLIQSQRGRKAGAFAALVWAFAGASAYAGYRHGTQPGAGRDVKWFFPFMALAGPLLLHLILKRARVDKQLDEGRRLTYAPAGAYGWKRWVPVFGAFTETYCAWRLGHLEGIVRPAVAINRYRALRSEAGRSGLRVLRALRSEAERLRIEAGKAANARSARAQTAPTERVEANTPAPKAAPPRPNTERRTGSASPNGGQPNSDLDANLDRIKAEFPDWRTNTPSVRKIAGVLGMATSTGLAYRNRLLAEQGDDAEERSA